MHSAAQPVAKHETSQDDSWEASISAWMDGETDQELLSELSSPQGKQAWDTYHLIGDVLRNNSMAITPSPDFHARLSRALDAELPIVAPVVPRRRSPLMFGLSGLAVAAAVAGVVWVVQPYLSDEPTLSGAPVLAEASVPAAPEDSGLRDYLEAHRQMAGPSAIRQVSFDTGMGR